MSRKKALLAIGDRQWLKKCTEILRHKCFDVTPILDGLEGIELIRRHRFDLIIADESMEKAGPVEFVLNLKDTGMTSPVVLVTGGNMAKFNTIWKQCNIFFAGSRKASLGFLDSAIKQINQGSAATEKVRRVHD